MANLKAKPKKKTVTKLPVPPKSELPKGSVDSVKADAFIGDAPVATKSELPWEDPFLMANPSTSTTKTLRMSEILFRKLNFISEKTRISASELLRMGVEQVVDNYLKELGIEE